MSSIEIRDAIVDDLEAINVIHNHYVVNSTIMLQTEPSSIEERTAWFSERGGGYPVIVALNAKRVVGWAALSPYYRRSAGRCTVQDSIYVHYEMHGKGFGKALLTELLKRAQLLNYHSVVAEIHNEQASIKLHRRLGFEHVGHIREAGFKLGQWVDVILMQYKLNQSHASTESNAPANFEPTRHC